MVEKIKRQKIEERQELTYEEKQAHIARKSDERCCHCGKKVYFDFGATVEHFVPLSKGGTNKDINLYMLCADCNQKKGNYIYHPEDYMNYLKPQHMNKLKEYFHSYIQSFEFVNRHNIFACDIYKTNLCSLPYEMSMRLPKNKRNSILERATTTLWIKRATRKDIDKLTDYMLAIYKKRISKDIDRQTIKLLIEYYMSVGCIYYQESDKGVKTLSAIRIEESDSPSLRSVNKFLFANNFVLYNNNQTLSMLVNFIMEDLPYRLADEQNLCQIPITANFPLSPVEPISYIFVEKTKPDCLPRDDKDLQEFFSKFSKESEKSKDLESKIRNKVSEDIALTLLMGKDYKGEN